MTLPTPPRARAWTAEELLQKSTRISSSARSALEHVRDSKAIAHAGRAAREAPPKTSSASGVVPTPVDAETGEAELPTNLRGLMSSAMVERLRAKEKMRTEHQLRLDSATLQRAHRIDALPPVVSVVWAETRWVGGGGWGCD